MATSGKSWVLQEFSVETTQSSLALGHESGRIMATGSQDGFISLWTVGNASEILKFSGHSSACSTLKFSCSEELLCSGGQSGQVKIWDVPTGSERRLLSGHVTPVECLDFHSYGQFLASGSIDTKVKLWDMRLKGCIHAFTGHCGPVNDVKFSPDGRWLVSASDDGTCRIWDLTASKTIFEFRGESSFTCLQFHPQEFLLAAGCRDGAVQVFDVDQFHLVSSSHESSNEIGHVRFSMSGHCLFSFSQNLLQVHLWEPHASVLDSVRVKWGQPRDIAVLTKNIISGSTCKRVISNHVINLNMLQTSDEEYPNFPEPSIPPTPVTPAAEEEVTAPEVATKCNWADIDNQKNPQKAEMKNAIQKTGENDKALCKSDFHLPLRMFSNPDNLRPNNSVMAMTKPSPQIQEPSGRSRYCNTFKTPSPHTPTNILPHLTNDLEILSPQKEIPLVKTITPVTLYPTSSHSDIKSGHEEDQIIPEKLVSTTPVPKSTPQPQTVPPIQQIEFQTPKITPSENTDSLGLDMNAFLPAKKDSNVGNGIIPKDEQDVTEEEAVALIRRGMESMRIVLSARYKNLEIVRAFWSTKDIMTSMVTATRMKDQALLVDLLNVINLKGSLWSLDLCQVLLPEICELIRSKYESYITAACNSLKVVLRHFGSVIKSNAVPPPTSAVDLSREDRFKKCSSCHENLRQIRAVVEERSFQPGNLATLFRELEMMMRVLD